MFDKKIMIIAMLLVMALGLTAVSAADNATEDVAIADDSIADELAITEDEMLTATPTISDLNNAINNNSDSEITLHSDYTYSGSDSGLKYGIEITRDLTIDGNGYTLDGGGHMRMFHVKSGNVIFKNIIFKNGFAPTREDGGAVQGGAIFAEDNLIVEAVNCTFENNKAFEGGAIAYVNAVNCTFNSNSAVDVWHSQTAGGAIYFGDAINCIFYSNSATHGGAIWGGSGFYAGIAQNCIFDSNIADSASAIDYIFRPVINCTFINNIATDKGTVYCQGEGVQITDCLFENNKAKNGGAIYLTAPQSKILRCVFTKNNATEKGGAIYCTSSSAEVSNNIFLFNLAQQADNNIAWAGYTTYASASRNWFGNGVENYAEKPNGVLNYNTWLFLNATVNPNRISLLEESDITFKLYEYNPNSHKVSEYDNSKLKAIDFNMISENGETDNYVVPLGEEFKFIATAFGTGKVTAEYENVAFQTVEITICERSFKDLKDLIDNSPSNTIILDRNYVYSDLDSGLKYGIEITRDLTIDGNGYTLDGGGHMRMFHVKSGNVIFKNIIFKNGFAPTREDGGAVQGGAIFAEDNLIVEAVNCTFENNKAFEGGAIAYVNAVNCTFNSNSAVDVWHSQTTGGAILYGDAINCTFYSNTATHGGAIWGGVAENCIFDSNTADSGSAIDYLFTGISNCTFINNIATNEATVYCVGSGVQITDCIFINNKAKNGGAIYWNGQNGRVSNCLFVNNTANENGGAIYWKGAYGKVSKSVFLKNTVAQKGGAIYWINHYGEVSDNMFFANDASAGLNIYWEGDYTSTRNLNSNWFGNTAADYSTKPSGPIARDTWLFLNATVEPNPISILETSNITFKLYKYRPVDNKVVDYDNSNLMAIDLKITSTNGITVYSARLGEKFEYIPYTLGTGTVTAEFEDFVSYTAEVEIKGGGFSELEDLIANTQNTTIILDRDYAYDYIASQEGILIDKPVTIDGRGHVLDGRYKSRIFQVTSAGVTFKNITFINGRTDDWYDAGGAISSSVADGAKAINCTFKNNYADLGGAIYHVSAVDCIFDSNSVRLGGGAAYSSGIMENCYFYNNTASAGGAISYTNAINCTFDSNHASDMGGAVSNGYATDSTFNSNYAYAGGAIYNGNATNCTFDSNNAVVGGAICVYETGSYEFNKCTFTGNTATDEGGAVSALADGVLISNSIFKINDAGNGGAILVDASNCVIFKNLFLANTADGGIIYFENDGRQKNLKVNNNIFLDDETAIVFAKSDATSNTDYNWFGHNATDYKTNNLPCCEVWLFLNATSNPESVEVFDTCIITFDLYAYNSTSNDVSKYDPALLMPVNLTITTDGAVDKDTAKFGEAIEYNAISHDEHRVTAAVGNAIYSFKVNTIKRDISISVDPLETAYSENTVMTLHYNSTATGTVTVKLTGKKFNKTVVVDINSTLQLGAVLPDEYNVTVTYSGDGIFNNASANATLKVDKLATSIAADPVITVYDSEDYLIAKLTDENGKPVGGVNITVELNGAENYMSDENGTVKVPLKGLDAGNYTAKITFNEDDIYFKSNATADVTIKRANSTIILDNVTLDYGASITVTAVTEGATGITAEIDGKPFNVTGFNITVSGLDAGTHTLTVTTLPDANHVAASRTVNVTVNKLNAAIAASDKSCVINYAYEFSVTLSDANGKALSGKKVTFTLNGKDIGSATTNANGVATITLTANVLKNARAGSKNLLIKFAGDTNYNAASKTVKITISKEKTKIAAKKKTFKKSKKTKKYKITLKNSKGKAVKKVKVTLKVKGKTYKAKTNSKGKATFKIKNLKKKGTFKATVKFKGDNCYKASSKKVKIKIK